MPHAALAPSGQPIWLDVARALGARARCAMARARLDDARHPHRRRASRNAMVVHAAFGGSTNLLLHIPAIAHAAGLRRPTVDDWLAVNRSVPRLVDVLPNGPHPDGARLPRGRRARGDAAPARARACSTSTTLTVAGDARWARRSTGGSARERRERAARRLRDEDGVDPDDVIMSPDARARARADAARSAFVSRQPRARGRGRQGTAIDPRGARRRRRLPPHRAARASSRASARRLRPSRASGDDRDAGRRRRRPDRARAARRRDGRDLPGHLRAEVSATSARRSRCSPTRASRASRRAPCIGHVGPEALAGGPIGQLRDGDRIRVEIDTRRCAARSISCGRRGGGWTRRRRRARAARRTPTSRRTPSCPTPRASGPRCSTPAAAWGGCVYDVDQIVATLEAGLRERQRGR